MKEKYKKVLRQFFESPEKEFYVRQLSEKFDKSPTTTSKYLKKLEERGLLKSKRKYNHLLFKANTENKKYKYLKIGYNLKTLHESGLIDYLIKEFNYPGAIVLFGSFAKGENAASSDIDIMVVSSAKKKINLEKYEEELGHEIQLFVYSNDKIKKLKKDNKELLNSWVNGIVLYGSLEIFR